MKGKSRLLLLMVLTAVLLAGSALQVSAAGVKDVFDAEYYAGRYSDLKSAFGTDETALLNHFMTRGVYEGRVMSPILDVVAYRAAYADLNTAFGDDWNAYVNHYLTYGIVEKRTSGVLFDLVGYAENNPDVKEAYGDDYTAIARHYITYGIKEGRSSRGILKKAVTAASQSVGNSDQTGGNSPAGSMAREDGSAGKVSGDSNSTGSGSESGVSEGGSSDGSTTAPGGSSAAGNGSAGGASGEGGSAGSVTAPGGNNSANGAPGGNMSGTTLHVHSWELTDARAATCGEDGYNDYCCQGLVEIRDGAGCVIATLHCTETKREILKAAHTRPDKVSYITHENCTESGLIKYDCAVCGEAREEVVPALGHDYDKEVDRPLRSKTSTCKEAGYDVFLCRRCGVEVKEMRLPAEHTVKEWVVDREASCTGEGLRHGRCLACGGQVTESIPRISHVNVENINVYEDAYEENTSVRHSVQNITYCRDCGYIITAGAPGYVNCADAGKGICGTCGLAVTREASGAGKVYRAGEYYSPEAKEER